MVFEYTESLINQDKKTYSKVNFKSICLLFIFTIVLGSLIMNMVVYFYILPSDIDKFTKSVHSFTGKLDEITKYEAEIDSMSNKFDKIYSFVMKICEDTQYKNLCFDSVII